MYFIRACVEIIAEFALSLKPTLQTKTALCGKGGDNLWITGGKLLSHYRSHRICQALRRTFKKHARQQEHDTSYTHNTPLTPGETAYAFSKRQGKGDKTPLLW